MNDCICIPSTALKQTTLQKLSPKIPKQQQQELRSYAMKVQGELLGCFFHCTL